MPSNSTDRAAGALSRFLFSSKAYDMALGSAEAKIHRVLAPGFLGDGSKGANLAVGDILAPATAGSETLPLPSDDDFRWLADFRASGLDTAAAVARQFVASWISHHGNWSEGGWNVETVARRLSAWLDCHEFLTRSADPRFEAVLAVSLNRQARHLHFASLIDGRARRSLGVAEALVRLSAGAEGWRGRLPANLGRLREAVGRDILADGGHISRNPRSLLEALISLIEVRRALFSSKCEIPEWLNNAIDRATPMLRALRLGDGGLAVFNGGREGDASEVLKTLEESRSHGHPVLNAPHTGYQRLTANRTLAILDCGNAVGFAGTLAFELCARDHRVVVNCGAPPGEHSPLYDALRNTSAHSTVTVEDTNSSELLADLNLGERRARTSGVRRHEAAGDIVVEAVHDGYSSNFGMTHKRTLYLAGGGDDLRGEDVLTGAGGRRFAVRFHLHPDVGATVLESGDAVLLRLSTRQAWRFRASQPLAVEESVYFGGGERRRSSQIVVSGEHAGSETIVRWRFSRERPPA